MYREFIDFLTPTEVSPLNSSLLNRPISQIATNVAYLKSQLDAMGLSDNILPSQPCVDTVQVGTPVAWNSVSMVFEPALAGSKTSLGVCKTKASATLADIRLLGYDAIDLTASTGSSEPTAGIYYLSQTTAGELTSTRPLTGFQQPVLYADGQGGVYLLYGEYQPLAGPQGIQGDTGATGETGATGATGAQGAAALPGFKSGRWYTGPINYSPVGSNYSFAANKILAIPFAVPGGASLSDLAVKVLAAGNPGDEGRLGIYADSNYYPGSIITAANGVFNGGSAGAKVVSVNQTDIEAGQLVWLVMAINSGSMGIASRSRAEAWAFKGWDEGLQDPVIGYMSDFAYGSLPDAFPTGADELISVIPTIFAKVA